MAQRSPNGRTPDANIRIRERFFLHYVMTVTRQTDCTYLFCSANALARKITRNANAAFAPQTITRLIEILEREEFGIRRNRRKFTQVLSTAKAGKVDAALRAASKGLQLHDAPILRTVLPGSFALSFPRCKGHSHRVGAAGG